MGLRDVGLSAINAAFVAAGDAATLVIYRSKAQSTFNAATDSQGETTSDTELYIIYDFQPKRNEFADLDVDIDFTGLVKGIVKASPFPPNTPKTEDLIVDGTIEYKIKGINKIGPFSEAIGYELFMVRN